MFDFTKEIKLEPLWHKIYLAARAALYLAFLWMAFFAAYHIFFPSVPFTYSFTAANSVKNLLVSPRTEQQAFIGGTLPAASTLTFNADPFGQFSNASVTLTLDSGSTLPQGGSIKVRKSYQSFFYPVGDPIGFKDGALLSSQGQYYLVSQGALRKFSSTDILGKLGFSPKAFLEVTKDDLKYNAPGNDIIDKNNYPDDTLIAVGDAYYSFKNGTLMPFTSSRAFLSQYSKEEAIQKDEEFLKKFPVSEKPLGFADGTLASSDQAVFILSGGKRYPVLDPTTFVTMGYSWDDVISLNPEELGMYGNQKQFTLDSPHPDGTLFIDQKTGKYFVINGGQKHPIESQSVLKTYLSSTPISADSDSLSREASCTLKKKFLSFHTYVCTFNLDGLAVSPGNSYQFDAKMGTDAKIAKMDTVFYTPITWNNLRNMLSNIKGQMMAHYAQK